MSRAIFGHLLKTCAAINKENAPRSDAPGGVGPSGATRTPGLLNPNQARYHLRYTRIFSFCYYTTLGAKIKDFPVCGQSCGQSRFSARFRDPAKWRKRPCHKAFRASAVSVVDGAANAPKASALPTALHPVMKFSDCGQTCSQRRCGQCCFSAICFAGKPPPLTVSQRVVKFWLIPHR